MSVLPFLGVPLHWPPALLGLTALVIAPGAHLLLSPLLEGRRVTWRDDYAAVLIGDPLLAVAVGFAANLSRPAGPHGFPASWTGGCAWIAGGWAFGLWQSHHELSTGRYSRAQTLSPTKLWHQFIVYPVLGYWSPPPNGRPTELSGPLQPPRESSRPRWSSPPRERGPS